MADFQTIVDGFAAMTCIVSVEKLPDGGYGKIRIVTGNQSYIDSIEHPVGEVRMLSQKFVPNSEYTCYLTRDLNFESACYQAAVEKKCLHSYAHPDRFDVWFNMTFLPLAHEDDNICYCTYTMEINFKPNSERLSNVSGELASAVLEATISLRETHAFTSTMKEVVRDIRILCQGEHCSILLMNENKKSSYILCEDFDDNSVLKERNESHRDGFHEVALSWEDTISGSNCIIAKNAHDMDVIRERNPLWFQSLQAAGVRSVALFPLKSGTELLGYMWIANFPPDQANRIKETLELTTFILGSEISNRLLLERLKFMSSRDMLTGVLNRNEMNSRVEQLSRDQDGQNRSIGILFADLNGLKITNDTEGHDAGDRMLKHAARALREVFYDETIFRAGGDEFTIILTDTDEEDLLNKTDAVRKAANLYEDVNFAIGCCFESDCRNIHHALAIADQRMYEDKKKYYDAHNLPMRTNPPLIEEPADTAV